MRCVIQRVLSASVSIDGKVISEINKGLLVLAGYRDQDNIKTVEDVINKIINLRIFDDGEGKLNLSVTDIKGEILIVPNFTLYGDASKGRRPDFTMSSKAEISKPLYDETVLRLLKAFSNTKSGVFGANMQVNLINDGPLTIIYEK